MDEKLDIQEISRAFIEAAELRERKQRDYDGIIDYFPFGEASFCHEINKKALRLVRLAKNNTAPNNESVKDNLLDLINYASYYFEWLDGGLNE